MALLSFFAFIKIDNYHFQHLYFSDICKDETMG
jgi:hypothetical protein